MWDEKKAPLIYTLLLELNVISPGHISARCSINHVKGGVLRMNIQEKSCSSVYESERERTSASRIIIAQKGHLEKSDAHIHTHP